MSSQIALDHFDRGLRLFLEADFGATEVFQASVIADENWSTALEELVRVMGTTERLGGSRAQRDLLELTYANVLPKLGQTEEARRSLSKRRPALLISPPIKAYQA